MILRKRSVELLCHDDLPPELRDVVDRVLMLEALEAPRGGVVVDVAKPPGDVVREICRRLGLSG